MFVIIGFIVSMLCIFGVFILHGGNIGVVLKALRTNTAFFQKEVAQRLGLKFAPRLNFQPDESFDEADRIEKLLSDPMVARDLDDTDD